jgi:hypothetical protein
MSEFGVIVYISNSLRFEKDPGQNLIKGVHNCCRTRFDRPAYELLYVQYYSQLSRSPVVVIVSKCFIIRASSKVFDFHMASHKKCAPGFDKIKFGQIITNSVKMKRRVVFFF